MIEGVEIRDLVVHADEHGYLYEMLSKDWPECGGFGRVYLSVTYPGVIKGWHVHARQTDRFCVVRGMAKTVLYDDRPESSTCHELMEVCFGEHKPRMLVFPPNIMHGFVALNNEPAWLVNIPDVIYDRDAPDELRIPFDKPIKQANGKIEPYTWFKQTEIEECG